MTERPILFSAPMVRALLDGTKTQTRRVVKPQFAADALPCEMPATDPIGGWVVPGHSGLWWCDAAANADDARRCPYGKPSDRLWVREAWARINRTHGIERITTGVVEYAHRADMAPAMAADRLFYGGMWRPSIHMPRAASRITLEVTGVRVERLQEITRGDAMAEGCPFPNMAAGHDPREWYAKLWNDINGPGSWDANPWVWAITFRRVDSAITTRN